MMQGEFQIEVKREDVLGKLQAHLDTHRAAFTEAKGNYRTKVVEAMKARAAAIESGGEIELFFDLPEPEDHSTDYEDAIEALTWDVRDTIPLTQSQFRQYVQDKWHWGRAFLQNTMSYTAAGMNR